MCGGQKLPTAEGSAPPHLDESELVCKLVWMVEDGSSLGTAHSGALHHRRTSVEMHQPITDERIRESLKLIT
jgi:hypothetical protein